MVLVAIAVVAEDAKITNDETVVLKDLTETTTTSAVTASSVELLKY